jgi:CubicO group peptidase (beta-lactamase class C family)
MTQRSPFLLVLFLAAILVRRGGADDRTRDWPKPDVRPGRSDAEIAAAITAYAQRLYDTQHFSGIVLAAKPGAPPIVARAYGFANAEAKTPNTLDTRFNIGSINKVMTKVAIAQLAEAGKLGLDDTVARRLPELRIPSPDQITIRQLIDHRSGLGDTFGAKYDAAPPARLRDLVDFVPLFADEPLGFQPGSQERYSNAGYIVLGLIIEQLSGETYRDYIARHVLARAGMTSTGFWAVDEQVANRATGYTLRDGNGRDPVPNTSSLPGRPSSAGGAYATVADLQRFYAALLGGRLASARWTNWIVNNSLDDGRRDPAIGVAGGAPGINAAIELAPGWIVIALANLDPPAAMVLASGAMDIIRGRVRERGGGGSVIRRGPPQAPAKTELARDIAVPAKLVGHRFTVEAKLDGKGPFRFAIDSGSAGMLRITPAIQHALGLAPVGEALSGDPSGKNPQRLPVVRIGAVELGGARFAGVEATVSESRDGDGVIGLPLFATLTATLDYPKQRLRLGRQPLAATDPHAIAFTVEHGVPVIDIDAGGVALRADVDTGSPAVFTIPAAWSAKLAFAAPPRVVGGGRTVSNEFEIRAAELRGELRVAGFALRAPRIDLVEVFPVANLGSQFLRRYAVTFDLANHRMALAQ